RIESKPLVAGCFADVAQFVLLHNARTMRSRVRSNSRRRATFSRTPLPHSAPLGNTFPPGQGYWSRPRAQVSCHADWPAFRSPLQKIPRTPDAPLPVPGLTTVATPRRSRQPANKIAQTDIARESRS